MFLVIFGWPSFNTYFKKDVFFNEYSLESKPIPAPAVTICLTQVRQIFFFYFKYLLSIVQGGAIKGPPGSVYTAIDKFKGDWTAWFSWICERNMSTAEEYFDCMDSAFYTQEELVLGAALFDYPTTMFTNHSIDWTSHVSFMFNGQCLTSSAQHSSGPQLRDISSRSKLLSPIIQPEECSNYREFSEDSQCLNQLRDVPTVCSCGELFSPQQRPGSMF